MLRDNSDAWLGVSVEQPANGVLAGVTTRAVGHSSGTYAYNNLAAHVGEDMAAVTANRRALQTALGARRIQWLEQVHGQRCFRATMNSALDTVEADAVWTDTPGLALAIMTADCVPVLLWAQDGSVAGAAHAGWRGLRDGVISALVNSLPVASAQLFAWIGPCISQAYYEVGEEVWSQFAGEECPGVLAASNKPDKRLLDLTLVAQNQLSEQGIRRVMQSGLCTYSDQAFYSHRRDANTGRMASVIMLQAET